jgi:hypothetical protein
VKKRSTGSKKIPTDANAIVALISAYLSNESSPLKKPFSSLYAFLNPREEAKIYTHNVFQKLEF